jgi:uncharacterized repeat protein (TIGR01451 family)
MCNTAADGGYIAGKIGGQNALDNQPDSNRLLIPPGATESVVQMFFMPLSTTNGRLEMSMFKYQSIQSPFYVWANTWIAEGVYYLFANDKQANRMYNYAIQSSVFKMHFVQPKPAVSANTTLRTVVGYNNTTMEWSYNGSTYRSDVPPIVEDDAHSIYIRVKGDAGYSVTDGEYANYKQSFPSEPVILEFPDSFFSCKDTTSVTKTSAVVQMSGTDGKVRVGDRIEYEIIAKNTGNSASVWTDAVFTDTLPNGVDFNNNIRINGSLRAVGTNGITFASNTLTIPLGNIQGGTEVKVTFEVIVNKDAYGIKIINGADVKGKDGDRNDPVDKYGDDGDGQGGGGLDIVDRANKPTIDAVTVGDNIITGTSTTIGATIIVNVGDGGTNVTVTVQGDNTWTANVTGRITVAGRTITAIQRETNKDDSEAATTTVQPRPDPVKEMTKTSESITRPGETKRVVGDTLRYTITVKNTGPDKSLWTNVIIYDTLPWEVDYVVNSVEINGDKAGAAATYDSSSRMLTVRLNDIPGGSTKVVTFDAVINNTAYGKVFKNTANIDGEAIVEGPDDPEPVVGKTAQPEVDEVNEGDRTITGKGIYVNATPLILSRITVIFPDGVTTRYADVGSDFTWSVIVPSSIFLEEGATFKVTQTFSPDSESDPVTVTVMGKKAPDPYVTKVSENTTTFDGTTRVNDKIKYTITLGNAGSPKSYWTGAEIKDVIPKALELDTQSVYIGSTKVYPGYDSDTQTLYIPINGAQYASGIKGGTSVVVTFIATVKPGTHGEHVMNSVKVTGLENGDPQKEIDIDADEDGGGFDITSKSGVPTVEDIYRGDKEIKGKGETGAIITVELPDGSKHQSNPVDQNGDWTVTLPQGKDVNTGDVVKVTQTEDGKGASNEVSKTVLDKVTRGLHGYVAPLAILPQLQEAHAVTIELRKSYKVSASPALIVTATLVPGDPGLGEFTFDKVPFGDYLLVIYRPGFLVRCMYITVSPTDADMREIAPPNTKGDDGIFNLIPGDVNEDFNIDTMDFMAVQYYIDKGAIFGGADYYAGADFDANGSIDIQDLLTLQNYWNYTVNWYAGAEGVVYNT